MIRRFLTPRWVTIHVLAIAIIVIFIFFGRWQLHRWEHRGISVVPADSHPAVALTDLVSPDEPLPGSSIGRQTMVTGQYDGAHQLLVTDRELGGRSGYWVLTPLRPNGDSTASAIVVRGWVATPDDPALEAPTGPVSITGRLYASEDPPPVGTGATGALPAGQVHEVNTAELTAAVPYRILDGFLLLAGQTPTVSPAPAVVPVPVNKVDHGGGLYNLAYALQWWLFAFAVVYFWTKLVRGELVPQEERVRERLAGEPAAAARRIPAPAEPRLPEPSPDATAEEDAELAAYNRYLADLQSRSSRSRS